MGHYEFTAPLEQNRTGCDDGAQGGGLLVYMAFQVWVSPPLCAQQAFIVPNPSLPTVAESRIQNGRRHPVPSHPHHQVLQTGAAPLQCDGLKTESAELYRTVGGFTSMDTPDCGFAAMRRGSYDDAAASLRPHLRHLAQRRRSAPSLVFGKALGMSWSPIREEASCYVSVDQSPFVLGLTSEFGELLLDQGVQVTEGSKTSERHLFLFSDDVLVFAKLKSPGSYRLRHKVRLEDVWLYGFEEESEEDEGMMKDIDFKLSLILAWALNFCLVCFCSSEVKQQWLDTLYRKIQSAQARAGCACASSAPDALMKVLSASVAPKTLTGGGMEEVIEFPLEVNAKIPVVSKRIISQEEGLTQLIETKWSLVRKLSKVPSFISKACRVETENRNQLFGQNLSKISPDGCSLPKPVAEMLMLLRKKGPSTEGVFRKPCNSKNMRDVREQLSGGSEVDLGGQPVALLVGLLKSFLKELPGSLLVSELYDKWMAALDNEDAQLRAQEITKVLEDLPGLNKLLLQHLVCVLHHVVQNADANRMDAHNLAVCIGPTLLQLDDTPLDEQKQRMTKATELTQFLIENWEILGSNVLHLLDTDEDSLSSIHHDSAYDSTDPDGDGEAGANARLEHEEYCSSSSSSSLSAYINTSSWPSDVVLNAGPAFNRRCSEPIILLSADFENLRGHTRSHDDCSKVKMEYEDRPLTKQISEDSILRRGAVHSASSFPKLRHSSKMTLSPYVGKDCSSSSLESTTSNQSDGSVFTSSPVGSPGCERRPDTTQTPQASETQQNIPQLASEGKKNSQPSKVLTRTRSLGAFCRNSLKKDLQKEYSFPCGTLKEDSQSEADLFGELHQKPRPLSAIEVFRHMDSRQPCSPPSYEQAVQNVGLPPQYRSMTVQDAVHLERRSRPSSVSGDFPSAISHYVHNHQCFSKAQDGSLVVERQPFRQRAKSESVSGRHQEAVSRRCSQPLLEELSYAKESYV